MDFAFDPLLFRHCLSEATYGWSRLFLFAAPQAEQHRFGRGFSMWNAYESGSVNTFDGTYI